MKSKELLNLDREFIKWFYEDEYPDFGCTRSHYHTSCMLLKPNKEMHDYWLREAFKQGARALWEDINYTLAAYACAVEGLDPEMVEPCEIFDRARENLHYYVYKQLELFDEAV